jgi:hypothetical protein
LIIQIIKRGYVNRTFYLLTTLTAATAIVVAQDSSSVKPAKEISYSKEVAPILEKFCATCHNEDDEHPSQLYMDSYDQLMKGGKAVLPGNGKESMLVQKMASEPPFGKVMPPPDKTRRPTAEQIELIRLWIDQGAKKN